MYGHYLDHNQENQLEFQPKQHVRIPTPPTFDEHNECSSSSTIKIVPVETGSNTPMNDEILETDQQLQYLINITR